MILKLFYFMLLIVSSETSTIKVDHFEIQDLNNSSLIDSFPIYFKCNLNVLGLNLSFIFRREENKIIQFTKLYLNQTNVHNYESEIQTKHDQFTANAILFLNEQSFFNKTNHKIGYEIIMNIFKKTTKNNTKITELFLKLILNRNSNKRNSNLKRNYLKVKFC